MTSLQVPPPHDPFACPATGASPGTQETYLRHDTVRANLLCVSLSVLDGGIHRDASQAEAISTILSPAAVWFVRGRRWISWRFSGR